ncbi:type II toxin-antitoxin system PemK/MazF family toxin [Aneurinibacillus aneurinilyticus]|uniref:type II toxin-antitoxin system PemK/MazF family toxin n=1 Tax=Aneurinibacillus aneurinilyticus TaxID=1391 RepID=UPI0023EF82D9|nr:type II toxin-antitoxin system PemK/MazF family toxin [Aneurinibacillus aneurinilyticus]
MPSVGEVYWAEMQFEDEPDSKVRPVVVLGEDEEEGTMLVLIMELTSKGPKARIQGKGTFRLRRFDTLKVPIVQSVQIGMKRFSYAKVHRTLVIEADGLDRKNYIGTLSLEDIANIQHSYALYKLDQIGQQLS